MTEAEMWSHFRSIGWGRDPASRHVFDFTVQASRAARGGAILDAGAGHQACKPFFEDSIYIAQEHPLSGAEAKSIRTFDILCDAMDIPLVDDCVRVIFSNVSVEHMRYPEPFFREAHRVLEPGGRLFVQVPFVYLEHEKPYDFQRPTSFGLKRWFDDAGFESCEVKPSSSSVYTLTWAAGEAFGELFSPREGGSRFSVARIGLRVVQKMFACVGRLFDRGPSERTLFPIGWTAIGVKRGAPRGERIDMTALQFLEKHRAEAAFFEGGALRLPPRSA
jgi:SAM-dependent methyltransferase